MTFNRLVLLAPAAYALHILEEAPGFVAWTRLYPNLFSPTLSDRDFVITNAVLMLAVITAVALCVRQSIVVAGLSVAGWQLSNAVFHIALTISSGIYSPGAITAVGLYVPLAAATFRQAGREHLLTPGRVGIALFLGVVVANVPLRLLQYWL